MSPRAVGALAVGALLLAGLGLAGGDGLSFAEVMGLLLAWAAGVTAVATWAPMGGRVAGWLEAFAGGKALRDADEEAGPAAVPEEPVAERALREVLATLADELAARRLVVWRVDRVTDTAIPEHAWGEAPVPQAAAGNPLSWVVEERTFMRLDPAPDWSHGDVVAAPIDDRRALSVEPRPGRHRDPEELGSAVAMLRAVLTLVDRETDARTEGERLDRIVDFLRGLSRDRDPARVPESLAPAALDLVGGTGSAVTSWDGAGGEVLARAGVDGPDRGDAFTRGDGDLAHAGRVNVTVRRSPDGGGWPPLTTGGERWTRTPPYRVVVPLVGPDGETGGLVAVWGDRPPAEQGVVLLEALGPLLSLQLQRATDLVRFRDRATVDPLTGLPNRAVFDERLDEEQARFHRYRRPVSLLVIDLDRFKAVNDTYGHEAGDAVLREVASVVRRTVRDVDVPARYGGEEMVVLMPETMLRAAQDVAERIREAVAEAEIVHEGRAIPVTASIGVSGCPEAVEEPRMLFERADRALYAAKEGGRNRVVVGTADSGV